MERDPVALGLTPTAGLALVELAYQFHLARRRWIGDGHEAPDGRTARRLVAVPAAWQAPAGVTQAPFAGNTRFGRLRAMLPGKHGWAGTDSATRDPYATLHVQPDADPELIALVFQHLLREALSEAEADPGAIAALERAYARVCG
jgi:hypothetical protein